MSQYTLLGTGNFPGGFVQQLTGDIGVATPIAGNINVQGGGNVAGNSGAVFTGTPGNLDLTFNYLSLPNTVSKDFGTIYFGGSSNTEIHNYKGAFFGVNVGNDFGGQAASSTLIGIGTTILNNYGHSGISFPSNLIGIGNNIMPKVNTSTNLIGIGQNIYPPGADTISLSSNMVGIGINIFNSTFGLSGITNCIGIGNSCLASMQSSQTDNIAIGDTCLNSLADGSYNVAIGYQAGANCNNVGGNSSNIYLQNPGTNAESNTLRIGVSGGGNAQVNNTYIAGINGVNVGSVASVVSISGDHLGSTTITAGTGITVTPGANTITISASGTTNLTYTNVNSTPYVVLSTDEWLGVDCSGGAINIQLPNAPATGRVFYIKDRTGSAATHNITVTTVGGAVNIDGATSFVMNTNYQAIEVLFDGSTYQIG